MRYKKDVGDLGERFAAEMLMLDGYKIINRNYAVKGGEIDIIAIKNGVMHFVEVKTRRGDDFGFPSEAVTNTKQKRLRFAARKFLAENRGGFRDVSFDVFEVMANHIEDCM